MAETRISGALVFDGIYGDLAQVGLPIPLVASLHLKNLTLEGTMWNVRCSATGVLGWDVPPLNFPPGHVVLGPAVPQDNLFPRL